MTGDEDQSPPLRERLLDDVPPVRALEQVEHGVATEARQHGRLDGRSAEVLVRATRDPVDVRLVEARERRGDLSLDDTASNAEWTVA